MKRVLVVGATGSLGLPLAESLAQRGLAVWGASRLRSPEDADRLLAVGVEPLAFDALSDDPARLPDVETVFFEIWDRTHLLGAAPDPAAVWALNYEAVGRIASRYAGEADLINGSTGCVYGPGDRAAQETDPPHPTIDYGYARLCQEKLIDFLSAQAGSRALHLRLYHANSVAGGLLKSTAEDLLAGKPIGFGPREKVQVIDRAYVIDATFRAMDFLDEAPQVINLCHPHVWLWDDLARTMAAHLGVGDFTWQKADECADESYYGDSTRMIEHFGPPPGDVNDLVEDICRSVKDHGH